MPEGEGPESNVSRRKRNDVRSVRPKGRHRVCTIRVRVESWERERQGGWVFRGVGLGTQEERGWDNLRRGNGTEVSGRTLWGVLFPRDSERQRKWIRKIEMVDGL